MPNLILYQNNSQFIALTGLQDQSTDPATYINNAVLTATLYTGAGVAVTGAENMNGTYQTASNGNYRFAVDPATFDPEPAFDYVLIINGTYGASARFHAEIPTTVKTRTQGTET